MSRTNFGIQTNSVDPDQTAPRETNLTIGCVYCGKKYHDTKHFQGIVAALLITTIIFENRRTFRTVNIF